MKESFSTGKKNTFDVSESDYVGVHSCRLLTGDEQIKMRARVFRSRIISRLRGDVRPSGE